MIPLKPGFELVPLRDPGPDGVLPRYRIEGVTGKPGGFGITYTATKQAVGDGDTMDFAEMLGLEPGTKVAIKEFFPRQFAERDETTAHVLPGDEEQQAHHFELFLDRFRKEAERMFVLTCLAVLRDGEARAAEPLRKRIGTFLAALGKGPLANESEILAQAIDLIYDFDEEGLRHIQAMLARRNLPAVYDYFTANGTAYYVMEFLEGGTLKEHKRAAHGWPWRQLEPFIHMSLAGLEEMHLSIPGSPLIHCDIKPGNIMFRSIDSDRPVLIDFGLARSAAVDDTVSFVPGLTMRYAAEELVVEASQTDRRWPSRIGPRTDIYAMAVVFAELANQNPKAKIPRVAERKNAQRGNTLGGIVFPASFPPAFEPAIRRALEIEPERRPQTVKAWRAELFRTEPQVEDDSETTKPGDGSDRRQIMILVGIAALLIAAMAIWIVPRLLSFDAQSGTPASMSTSEPKDVGGDRILPPTPAPDSSPTVAAPSPTPTQTRRANGSTEEVTPTPTPEVAAEPDPPPTETVSGVSPGIKGMEAVTSPETIANLRRKSGGTPVDPVRIRMAGSDFNWLGNAEYAVHSCTFGSAARALAAAAAGKYACIVDENGTTHSTGR